jgi:ABC-type antimicrobial peptide transport system permease subunit
VFGQIMAEAAMIGTAGAVGGIVLSPLVVAFLGNLLERGGARQSIPVQANVPVLLAVGLGALVVSLVFAAIPAKGGSSLVITDALRSE